MQETKNDGAQKLKGAQYLYLGKSSTLELPMLTSETPKESLCLNEAPLEMKLQKNGK